MSLNIRNHFGLIALLACVACEPADEQAAASTLSYDSLMNPIAQEYVKLVLAVGEHDGGYVDAYYGPEEWRTEAKGRKIALDTLALRAQKILADLKQVDIANAEDIVKLRHSYLDRQAASVNAYIGILNGDTLTFDEESRALYDTQAPTYDEAHFQTLLDSLGAILPGAGPVAARVEAYRKRFVIPSAKLDTVFKAAIAEARKRSGQHLQLPPGEEFVLEYVKDKPWSGYNWYQGNGKSLIQINTDLPIFIDRAVDLAAHEGYPGHHVYNALLEKNLVRDRGWQEFSVYPLFSPQSLIAEGSANYGIEVAFPGSERMEFERDVLYPLAGLDSSRAAEYTRVNELAGKLSYAGNEAARKYLNREIDADSAAKWLNTYALMDPARARQRVKFIDTYRSYVINYNYGKDLVRDYVENKAGGDAAARWREFGVLLSSPRLPSGLK